MERDYRKYTHIVFDIDGTLLDTEKAVLLSLQEAVFEIANRRIELSDLRFALGIPGEKALEYLQIDDIQATRVAWHNYFVKQSDTIKLFEGVIKVLEKLKNDSYEMGIITSKTKEEYKHDFLPFGIDSYFSTIICAEDTSLHKPNSEPMTKFLELSNAKMENVLYIGDTIYDKQCAKGAKVDFALALWGCSDPNLIDPDYILKYPHDLIKVLK